MNGRAWRRGSPDVRDRDREQAGGFSLVEMVVTAAMVLVVMAVAYQALGLASQQASAVGEMADQQSASRRVLDTMVDDVRSAWTGDINLVRLATMKPCEIQFYSPTRDASPKLRRVTYRAVGSDLQRAEVVSLQPQSTTTNATKTTWNFPAASTWVTVLRGLRNDCAKATPTNPIFAYRDTKDVVTTTATSVKRVAISVTVDRIVDKVPEPDTFATSVELRSA